jgi:hypothetical protein
MSKKRLCDMTPEQRERQRELNRINRRRHHAKMLSTHEGREKLRAAWRAKHHRLVREQPERMRARWQRQEATRRACATPRVPMAGNVYANAAPSPWRDVLLQVARLAPRIDDHDEIVSEAVLYVVEGMDIENAISKARTKVLRGQSMYRYAKPIDDCFWL